ncbi:magnesium ion transporter [Pseudocyphellaria aurata]|nr:magnesium ion transporter [Pseudocyphellaria aurata]
MTLIKVRGKKGPKIRLESQPPEPVSGSRATAGEPSRKKSRRHTARMLSSLERLPTELLEKVFFHCLNINLPRASPVLASALSSFHVKSQLIFKAFSSDQGHGLQNSEELIDILRTKREVAKLQSSILPLRWMTLGFLRQCIPVFFERTLLRQFKSFKWQWIDGSPAANLSHTRVAKFVQEAYRRARDGAEIEQLGYLSWMYSVSDEQTITIKLALVNGVVWLEENDPVGSPHPSKEKRWKLLNCLDECRVPEKLLHGPWTDEKCEFLTLLTRGRATVDWIDSTSGEVAEVGLWNALKERNERAVRLLIEDDLREDYPHEWLIYHPDWMASSSTCAIARRYNVMDRNQRSAVAVTPKMEHLRSAAIEHDCPLEILEILVNGNGFRKERNDPVLSSWAWRKKAEGDHRAEWLLKVLGYLGLAS